MIATRFSHDVPDSVAKGVDALIDGKFQALLKELKDYKDLLKSIAEKEMLVARKKQEAEEFGKILDGYIQEFADIIDLIDEMFSEYLASNAEADIELMLNENDLPPDVRKKQIRQQIETFIFLNFYDFYNKEKKRSSSGELFKHAKRLTDEILLIDPNKKEQVESYLKKRSGTHGLSREGYASLIGLEAKIDQESLTKIVHNNAGNFFSDLINTDHFAELNRIIENIKSKSLSDLAGYELYFLSVCTRKIIPRFKVFSAKPSYDELFELRSDPIYDIAIINNEIDELNLNLMFKLNNQPQTVIVNAFRGVLTETILLYEDEARILFKSFNDSWASAQALSESLDAGGLNDFDKINLIIDFLERQPEKKGLKTNSFDTFFLSALYKRNSQQPFLNTNPLYPQGQALMAPSTDIPPLLRGDQRLTKTSDRASIRTSTRLLLFKLRPLLHSCAEESKKYIAQHPQPLI